MPWPFGSTFAVLLASLGSIVLSASDARAQISPGPLARSHAAYEGPRNCNQCHGGRAEPTTQRCLACHREIALLQRQGEGFHARRDARGACSSCHPDHAGRDFELIQWPEGSPERFDHARGTGYSLEGSHATAKCAACHRPELRTTAAAQLSPRKATAGWVGLATNCTSCHTDPHRGALAGACTRCHDTGTWTDAPGFDHGRTDYPLTGKHADVSCAKCHLASRLRPPVDSAGQPVPVFRPVPFRDCSSCHADPHRGRLAGSCSACHVTSSFRSIDRRTFDHDRTRYPLRGQHATATCASCHVGFPSAGMRPAFATCASCHRDVHDGQATLGGKPMDCAACHRVESFTPATYTAQQHAAAAFPLLGRHARVECASCHATRAVSPQAAASTRPNARGGGHPAPAGVPVVDLRPRFRACADCHADAHGGQLAARGNEAGCNSCHSEDGWRPSTFSIGAHAALRLPLDGAHAAVPCRACHGPERPGLRALPASTHSGSAHVIIHPPETSCVQCHSDPHVWQQRGPAPPACTACHSTRAFRPTTMNAADHASTGYVLEGAHRAVPCVACHQTVERPRPRSTLVAAVPKLAPLTLDAASTCAGCHSDPHDGQFQKLSGGACDRCHGLDAFAPASRFNHARDARFALTGAHANTTCVACHRQPAGVKPGAPFTYAGLSPRCESCHAGTPARPRGGE